MKKLNRKIIGRVCVGIMLLALVLWLVPLPLPFHISLSGVRVEGSTAAEPAALEAKGWRLCRFLRRTELRATFTVETAQGTKIYEPVDCLWELTFPDGPIRHAYGADGTTAFFEVMDDGQDKRFVFSADRREPAETMDFLRVEPVDA